jgi:DNA-binding IclR family transcriptional regulator
VHRAAMAERFGVSPAHIAGMLADAEEAGWLRREQPSSRVVLDPAFAEKLDIWIARELTIVGMWIEAKFGTRAQPQEK